MKAVINYPAVYCETHGAFLEDCWLETNLESAKKCMWYFDVS